MRSQLITAAILDTLRPLTSRRAAVWFAVTLLLCVSGCAIWDIEAPSAAAKRGGDEDLRGYVERVFLLQNRVLSELIMNRELYGDVDPANDQLESSIVMNCRHLVESATFHMEGKEAPLALKKKVLDTVEDCEDAAKAAE